MNDHDVNDDTLLSSVTSTKSAAAATATDIETQVDRSKPPMVPVLRKNLHEEEEDDDNDSKIDKTVSNFSSGKKVKINDNPSIDQEGMQNYSSISQGSTGFGTATQGETLAHVEDTKNYDVENGSYKEDLRDHGNGVKESERLIEKVGAYELSEAMPRTKKSVKFQAIALFWSMIGIIFILQSISAGWMFIQMNNQDASVLIVTASAFTIFGCLFQFSSAFSSLISLLYDEQFATSWGCLSTFIAFITLVISYSYQKDAFQIECQNTVYLCRGIPHGTLATSNGYLILAFLIQIVDCLFHLLADYYWFSENGAYEEANFRWHPCHFRRDGILKIQTNKKQNEENENQIVQI